MRKKRTLVYTVRWNSGMGRWVFINSYGLLMMETNKVKLTARGRSHCRAVRLAGPVELRIRTRSGRLQARHRYA